MNERPTMKDQFLTAFLKEWEIYNGDRNGETSNSEPLTTGEFDLPLKAGELRLFGESERTLVGLLYKKVESGWIVLPTSCFSVPATEQEIIIGNRVYQLWNLFSASDKFAEKSWLVDTVSDADRKDLCEALLHVMVGDPMREDLQNCTGLPIRSIEDPRLDYERAYATGLMFQSIQDEESDRVEVGVLDLPVGFFKRMVDEEIPYRLAAATDSDSSFMLLLDGNSEADIRKRCVECNLVTTFRSINPDDDPYSYVFKPKSEIKGIQSNIAVQARNRDTLEVVGEGVLEAASGEIVIKTTGNVKTAIEKPEQIVLVMVHKEV